MPVLVSSMKPTKDPEVRLKFFSLLSKLMMNCGNTLDSRWKFGDFAVTVVRDIIMPNCVWVAGKTAAAIRTTAVSCMWALLQSGVLSKEKVNINVYSPLQIERGLLNGPILLTKTEISEVSRTLTNCMPIC